MSVVNAYSITVSGTVSINVNTLLQSRKLSTPPPLGAILLLLVSTLAISQSSQFTRQHSQLLSFNKTKLNLRIYKISEDIYNIVKLSLHMLTA